MPMHDWTKINPGIYHAFHNTWIGSLQGELNAKLPRVYYAIGEQRAGQFGPDILTLKSNDERHATYNELYGGKNDGTIALAEAPPQVSITQEFDRDLTFYLSRQRHVAIRHSTGDRLVALIEIVSPANKRSTRDLGDFVDKLIVFLNAGVHVLVIDPFPPNKFAPDGIHGIVAERLGQAFELPAKQPLVLSSYCVSDQIISFVEPYKVGDLLHRMPVFLSSEDYINAELEAAYNTALQTMPQIVREDLSA